MQAIVGAPTITLLKQTTQTTGNNMKDQIIKSAIKGIKIEWSEDCELDNQANQLISLEDYQNIADAIVKSHPESYGYDKTELKLIMNDGSMIEMRHDICANEQKLIDVISCYL